MRVGAVVRRATEGRCYTVYVGGIVGILLVIILIIVLLRLL